MEAKILDFLGSIGSSIDQPFTAWDYIVVASVGLIAWCSVLLGKSNIVLAAHGISTLPIEYPQPGKLMWLAAVLILCQLTYMTHNRNEIWRSGITLWKDAVAKSPNKPRPLLGLGKAYMDAGDDANAFITFSMLAAKAYQRGDLRDQVTAQTNNAVILAQNGDLTGAARLLQGVLRLDPADPYALNELAIILLRTGNPADALELFDVLLGNYPDRRMFVSTNFYRAYALNLLSRCAESDTALQMAQFLNDKTSSRNPLPQLPVCVSKSEKEK